MGENSGTAYHGGNILAMPEILLPQKEINLEKWAVIACDQFTQEPSYWEQVEQTVGDCPSTLRLILPEIYLDAPHRKERIEAIHRTMHSYLHDGVFAEAQRTFVYLERTTPSHARRGFLACIDLEHYDWENPKNARIRATEDTVRDRIPPRMEIRQGAPLEVPHIIVLLDDASDLFLQTIAEKARQNKPLYHTKLMMGSGEVTGWGFDEASLVEELLATVLKGKNAGLAVGDGNHSLAAAKAYWEAYKAANKGSLSLEKSPARYALVEIANIYDPGIAFEPIHRVLLGRNAGEVLDALGSLPAARLTKVETQSDLSQRVRQSAEADAVNCVGFAGERGFFCVEFERRGLAVALIQAVIDEFLASPRKLLVDYVHGETAVFQGIGHEKAGILLPPLQKSGLFATVSDMGALPRKSFSMGSACEKRFYLESRKLF